MAQAENMDCDEQLLSKPLRGYKKKKKAHSLCPEYVSVQSRPVTGIDRVYLLGGGLPSLPDELFHLQYVTCAEDDPAHLPTGGGGGGGHGESDNT